MGLSRLLGLAILLQWAGGPARADHGALHGALARALCLAANCTPHGDCRERCANITQNFEKVVLTQEKTDANVGVRCRDVNRLVLQHKPGIFVIEARSKEDEAWTSPVISDGTTYGFSNLNAKSRRQYRIREVTRRGVALPNVTEWFETNEENYTPKKVKNISISGVEATSNGKLQAYLNIVPSDDLNCLYNVVHWGEEHNLFEYQLDAAYGYRLKLRHLEYERNNTIYVISRNEAGSRQSENSSLTFVTPSCLSVHNNLIMCAPPRVTGLRVVSLQLRVNTIDLKVAWDGAALEPDKYTITVQPLDHENNTVESTVDGNETSAIIPQVVLSKQYKVGVTAESRGGTSFEWQLFTGPHQVLDESRVFVAFSAITSIIIFLTITYTYYRLKHVKGHTCQYSFFENMSGKGCALEESMNPFKSSSAYDFDEAKPMSRDKFEIGIDRLTIKTVLGSGISGIVKLATLRDDHDKTINVAIKMLREDASAEDVRNFHREILLMKSAGTHRNIVSLIGCCTLNKNPLLVVEFCSKGDLQAYLKTIYEESITAILKKVKSPHFSSTHHQANNNSAGATHNCLYDIQQEVIIENNITTEDLLSFARQVSSGMEFLSSNRIVHRDLAARNVLVCADGTVKISDFGLSRDIYQENVYKKHSNEKMPLKWMAIEALTHQIYTTYSDVWSFGVLLYEIVTLGGNPYPEFQGNQILQLLKTGYRMKRPANCGFYLYEIMRSCWHDNPLSRPTFTQLRHQLDKLLSDTSKNEYLNLSLLLKDSERTLSLS